jgi:sugar phosphate isomerase/epimerase
MDDLGIGRRDFIRLTGASAAVGGIAAASPGAAGAQNAQPTLSADAAEAAAKYPQLAMITPYSSAKLQFAGSAGYQGVVIPLDDNFDPDKLNDTQIDRVLATARSAGVRIISIECMWGINHIARDPQERRQAQAKFVRCLEFGHRLGCRFVGTFSGGMRGATIDDQAKALADVFNTVYLPVCDRLDLLTGWENFPTGVNFATVPAAWNKVFEQVPSPRLGLEFDPSHLVRQFIDPYQAAWDVRTRIHAFHAKDTEITEPILQQVGINGHGWWRYRIPGQGRLDWPRMFTVLLQIGFHGGVAVEHEDEFWDRPHTADQPDFPQERKDGFLLASRFLRQYLPGKLPADYV